MTKEAVGSVLALVNACLNGSAAVLLFAGYLAVRRGEVQRHRKRMIAALSASAIFLCTYLVRVALTGTHRFPLEGPWKSVYLAVLLSHTVLAMALLPLVLRTFWLAARKRFVEHRRLARVTFPIWGYVSVTGVLVYLMLYHLPRFV